MITPETDSFKLGLHALNEAYSMPEYVKQAELESLDPEVLDKLPAQAFADPAYHRYPCHTKAATWVSMGYFLKDYDNIPEAEHNKLLNNFEKFAKYYGMEDEYARLLQETIDMYKKAEQTPVDNSPKLTDKGGSIGNVESICKAASWLVKQRNNLPLAQRSEMASRILKQAEVFNINFPEKESLEQTAGYGVNEPREVINLMRVRASMTKNAECSDELNSLADRLSEQRFSPFDRIWMKVACAIDDFDKMAGLMWYRENGDMPLPEEVVFALPTSVIKEADAATVQLQNGKVYQLSKLAEVSKDKYEEILGSDITSAIFMGDFFDKEAAAEILSTIPRFDVEALCDVLDSQGVNAIGKTKTAGYSLAKTLFPDWS